VGISTIKKFTSGRGMIRVTRQIKCLIAQALGVIPHPLPEVNFLMVEIPSLKPYIYSLFSYLLTPLSTIFQFWQSVLFVEEIGVPGENHRPVTTR
jgi:hypothetical protein